MQVHPAFGASGSFLERLETAVFAHPVLSHPFLERVACERLDREQLRAFAAQHYMYSRRFARNLASVIANSPDEHARTLLVLNMYEEIGEPSRMRDRVHLILLEEGMVTGAQLGEALEQQVSTGGAGDVVSVLIDRGIVSRTELASVMEHNTHKAKDLTHPALFRRFMQALGLDESALQNIAPIAETDAFNAAYQRLCRDGHWLQGLSAMGPGTECIVPSLYGKILQGIRLSGVVSVADYVFWTIHVHCDDAHGRNIIEAMQPYVDDPVHQDHILSGALGALDARQHWFDGLLRHVFTEVPARAVSVGRARADRASQPAPGGA